MFSISSSKLSPALYLIFFSDITLPLSRITTVITPSESLLKASLTFKIPKIKSPENKIIETVETKIDEAVDVSTTAEQTVLIMDSIPEFMVKYAASVGVDTEDIKAKISSEKISSENIATELTQKIAQPIVVGALTIIFFFPMAAILLFVLKWLAKLLSKLFKVPLVKTVNQILGGVLGACKGVLVMVFVCTVLEFLFSGSEGEFAQAVNQSYVINLLDNINPFVESLKDIF